MNKITLNDLYNMGDVLAGRIAEVKKSIPDPSDYQELVDDVDDLKSGKTEFHFIKSEGANNVYGDCTVITGLANGIIDFGRGASGTQLIAKLAELQITHIDFAIISHYHADHIGFDGRIINNLVNAGIDFTGCTFYLPHKGISWSDFIGADDNRSVNETSVKSKLEALNITWYEPNNLEEINLSDDLSVRFYNIGDYSDYYSYTIGDAGNDLGYTIYNSFSMIAEINSRGNHFLFTGDITPPAEAKNAQYIHGCDVYKVEHHGLNILENQTWLNKLNSKFAVIFQYSNQYDDVFTANRPTVEHLSGKAVIYSTYDGNVVITSKYGELSANGTITDINIGDIEKEYRAVYDTVNTFLDTYTPTAMTTISTYLNPNGKFVEVNGVVYFRAVIEYIKNVSTGLNDIISNLPSPADTSIIVYERDMYGKNTAQYMNYTTGWRINGHHTAGDHRVIYGIYAKQT